MDYLSCILALAQCHVRYVVQALAPGLGYEQFEERDCVLNIMCVCVCDRGGKILLVCPYTDILSLCRRGFVRVLF